MQRSVNIDRGYRSLERLGDGPRREKIARRATPNCVLADLFLSLSLSPLHLTHHRVFTHTSGHTRILSLYVTLFTKGDELWLPRVKILLEMSRKSLKALALNQDSRGCARIFSSLRPRKFYKGLEEEPGK